MNWLVFHIVCGHSFFTGIALVGLAAFASTREKPIFQRITGLSFFVGAIAIAISSTAIPYWYYTLAILATLAWIASAFRKPWRRWTPWAVAIAWLGAALIELPYHMTPALLPASTRTITVIGDSITAGIGADDTSETWPHILASEHRLNIQDLSHVGETAASALKRAQRNHIDSAVVVVEIGGNDVLGITTSAQFAHDLDALLSHIAVSGRQIIMFELPLPPFYHEYGRAQRSLAAKHNVSLVPKRFLLSVLADSDSTLDTVHLSQSGHQLMADDVWSLVKSAFGTD